MKARPKDSTKPRTVNEHLVLLIRCRSFNELNICVMHELASMTGNRLQAVSASFLEQRVFIDVLFHVLKS